MSNLSKRTYKYYFLNGLKSYGIVLLIELVLIVEWILIGSDEDLTDYVPRMFCMVCGLFTPLMNGIYSMYGPSWYDSLTLSMGARRKDIFVGQIIRQLIMIVCNTAVVALAGSLFLSKFFVLYAYSTGLLALLTGAAGLIVGYKLRRYGKIVIIIIAFGCAILGGSIGVSAAVHGNIYLLTSIASISPVIFPIIIVLIYVVLEAWVYKLSKTMMVR